MRPLSEAEIADYAASGDPLDKAGAYSIQNSAFNPVVAMAGCKASVMGLPLCHVVRTMHHLNITPLTDVPFHCQKLLAYACPISSQVLHGEA